jgi:hypothetical protein
VVDPVRWSRAGLPDFSRYKNGKKYAKLPRNIPKCDKIYKMAVKFQIAIKIPNISIPRPSKIFPNWDFWFENKSSGNPGPESSLQFQNTKMSRNTENFEHDWPLLRGPIGVRSPLQVFGDVHVVLPKLD